MPKSITISDLLGEKASVDVKTIRPDASLLETARAMTSHQISALIVTDQGGKLVGIVTERDLVRAIAENAGGVATLPVSDVMTRTITTCAPDERIANVLFLMNDKEIRHIPVIEGEELRGIVSIRDLTRAYELLQDQANTDALTGLSNRRHFIEQLDGELDRCRRYKHSMSVAMIDIDHFKKVNDTYGHVAGDKVLSTLADLLVRELRTVDWIGRLGGEEFALIFAETDFDKAKLACERLLATIRSTEIDVDDAKISITVSIGLAGVTPATQHSTEILKIADQLMYEAKAQGRDCVQVEMFREQPGSEDNEQAPPAMPEAADSTPE
ncbi:MAG: diguanylate cyclase [Alphaproteobacteria bacterium]|nr:diguanylate cyclase [Alphaproteobacteria bacterium]